MKIKHVLFSFAITLFVLVGFSSCITKQGAINRMERLTTDVQQYGAYYDLNDWKESIEKFYKVRKRMAKFDYSPAQRKHIGTLEGQYAKYLKQNAKESLKNGVFGIGSEIRGILEGLGSSNKLEGDEI